MRFIQTLIFIFLSNFIYSQDSVIISASVKYEHPSVFRKLMLGSNYRSAWATPVKMPVFKLDTTKAIVELGGGQQTKSLKFKDKDSVEWVLRTVDKDVEKALPSFFRNTFVERIVQDMVSGAHPYAALAVAELARMLSLAAPYPTIYYVADDPGLGPYRSLFAHSVCMLERSEPTYDNSNAIDTEDMVEELIQAGYRSINDTQLLKARLLDMLVGDWDRHHDQWKWGKESQEYYPVPRDRDQAFFFSNGLLVSIARLFSMKHLVGFRPENRKIRHLNRKSWKFDRQLLGDLEENDWLRIISEFRETINDKALRQAVNRLPPEIREKDGQRILNTLTKRRNALGEDAMKYYYWLSEEVFIRGSQSNETVTINSTVDGLIISVFTAGSKQPVFSRVINPRNTKKVNLYLLGGDDKVVAEGLRTPIKIMLNDGEGNDQVQNTGALRITLHNMKMPSIEWRK